MGLLIVRLMKYNNDAFLNNLYCNTVDKKLKKNFLCSFKLNHATVLHMISFVQ